jgi:hypothetical protein
VTRHSALSRLRASAAVFAAGARSSPAAAARPNAVRSAGPFVPARLRRHHLIAIVMTAAATGVVSSGAIVTTASAASFSGVTANPSSGWSAGAVTLTDDDGGNSPTTGTAMFNNVTGIRPAATTSAATTKCIVVSYGGNVAAGPVKLYGGAVSGTLGPSLLFTVEVGTGGSYSSCTGFSGSTLVTDVALSTFGATYTSYANGLSSGWSPAVGESRTFRISYRLSTAASDAMQGATCGMPFTWEAPSA